MSAVKTKPAGHRVGIYIRVSTEEQASNPEGSIKNQEERLRAVVKLKNMEKAFGEIKAVHVEAKSGKDTNRSELQKLLVAIRKREIDLVMVTELSRISRSVKDFSEIWDLMRANNCGFFSLRENFDTTTAAGEMVLLIVATLAQFERRQISERVAASFNIRAQRGLFNGGSIPVGYKRIPEKTGYLEIDDEQAQVVKMAFKTFLTEGALLSTAKWLNGQGYKLKREREGGGLRSRLGIFTIDNLQAMLRNKAYTGTKVFTNKGKSQEVEAVWPAIIDRDTFERVNQILDKNKRANKNTMERRFPFLLAGLVSCKACGDRLVGKSAHGRKEKIPYYEHAWATRNGSCVPGLKHKCQPYRVLAKRIEPLVWEKVIECLTTDSFTKELLNAANKEHKFNPAAKELEGHRHKVSSIEGQLSLMAERLVSLPASVSPAPIYSQMEKLEKMKAEAERALNEINSKRVMIDPPAELKDFQIFLGTLKGWLNKSDNPSVRALIARTLIKKIIVSEISVDVHFFIGETYVQIFLGEVDKRKKKSVGMTEMAAESGAEDKKRDDVFSVIPKKIPTRGVGCSNTLTFGRGDTSLEEQPEPHEIINYSSSRLCGLFEKSAPLYQSGVSLQKIAEQMQVSKSSVRDALTEGGIRIRPHNGTPEGCAAVRERRTAYANAPYGYAFLDGRLTVHPKEIQNVRRIVQLRSGGLSFNAIAKELNAKSIAPRSGKRWDHSVISEIIRRESDESLKQARGEA